jgi:major membrane immunogen (membrane-anchored lipoprotein)
MTGKPSYEELEQSIKQLEGEILEYVHKEQEFNEERKFLEYSHIKRTLSLMKINEELEREINERTCADDEELEQLSHKLRGRIKELNCLYDISSFRDATDFSLDAILQAVIDFIPPAFQYPEITCARINFGRYEFMTKNFKDSKWKLAHEITVNNEQIGTLEVCYLEKKPALDEGPFLKEAKNLIRAIAESIAKIVEREWAEVEIRKYRNHVEKLIKNSSRNIAGKTND